MLRFSDKYNRETLLYWPLNHTCGARFSDLFEFNIKEINRGWFDKINRKDIKKVEKDSILMENYPQKYITNGTCRFLLTREELEKYPSLRNKGEFNENGIEFIFSSVPDEVKRSMLCYLEKIKPIDSITKIVKDFQRKYNLKNMIGVHIRRGDLADRKVSPGKVSTDEKFIKRMKKLVEKNPKIKFFLATDSAEVENEMEKIFGDRIIKYQKTSFVRTDTKATQEGLIDLLLLSKTRHILGTYGSTFTEMAWWFGGCEAKVEIMKDLEKEKELFRNIKEEKRRVVPKVKKLILKIMSILKLRKEI